jgi:hypothetical protein
MFSSMLDAIQPGGQLRPMNLHVVNGKGGEQPRLLQPVLADATLLSDITESAQRACFDGMQARALMPYLPTNGPGMIEYLNRCQYLGARLASRGWVKTEYLSQVRFLSSAVPGQQQIRLVLTSGELDGDHGLCRRKGRATRQLAEDNAPWNPQQVLFTQAEVDEGLPLTIMVLAKLLTQTQLEVAVGVVGTVDSSGTDLTFWDSELLDVFDMSIYEAPSAELPASVPVVIDFGELNAAAGSPIASEQQLENWGGDNSASGSG